MNKTPTRLIALIVALVLYSCVTAQQQRTADIGPGTFPSSLPQSTPNADRAPPKPPERQPARTAKSSPSPASPGQINQSVMEFKKEQGGSP